MIAFVVATPLQLFNSISISFDKNEQADIFILGFAVNNIKEYIGGINECEFINEIIPLDFQSGSGKRRFIKDFLFRSKAKIKGRRYTELFITYTGDSATIFFNEFRKENPNIKVHFYEEGLGVYYAEGFALADSKKKRLFYKLFGIKSVNDQLNTLDVYRPELVANDNSISEIEKIDIICGKKQRALKSYISSPNEFYEDYKCVFFDQCFYRDESDSMFDALRGFDKKNLIEGLFSNIRKENLIIKPHPVCRENEYKGVPFAVDESVKDIWESIILHMGEGLNKKVFVTISSTAVLSAKIMFDLEPRIIILGRALKNEYEKKQMKETAHCFWNDRLDSFIRRFQSFYKDKDRVYIPDSLNDARVLIEMLVD